MIKRRQLAILIAAAVEDAVKSLQDDVDALKKRLSGVTMALQVAELRAAAMTAPSEESGLH